MSTTTSHLQTANKLGVLAALALLVAAGGSSCTRDNPAYCEGDDDCDTAGHTCDTERRECVPVGGSDGGGGGDLCEENADCEDEGARFCSSEGACISCEGGCDVYVDRSEGDDDGLCGADDAPCESISRAIERLPAESGGTVWIGGSGGSTHYNENLVVGADQFDGGVSLSLRAGAGGGDVTIAPASDDVLIRLENGPDLHIEGLRLEGRGDVESVVSCRAATLSLQDVEIADAESAGVDADECDVVISRSLVEDAGFAGISAENETTLEVSGSEITGSGEAGDDDSAGIYADGAARVVVTDSTIAGNESLGIHAEDTELYVQRTRIEENQAGGLRIVDSYIEVANNLIVKNGSADSEIGGVFARIDDLPDGAPSGGLFAFNTVADNSADDESGDLAYGVNCGAHDVNASSNIVYFESEELQALSDGCDWDWTYSNIDPSNGVPDGIFDGDSNNAGDDPELDIDFQLTNDSQCIQGGEPGLEEADADVDLAVDFAGESRPEGDAPDCGAYEYRE